MTTLSKFPIPWTKSKLMWTLWNSSNFTNLRIYDPKFYNLLSCSNVLFNDTCLNAQTKNLDDFSYESWNHNLSFQMRFWVQRYLLNLTSSAYCNGWYKTYLLCGNDACWILLTSRLQLNWFLFDFSLSFSTLETLLCFYFWIWIWIFWRNEDHKVLERVFNSD